jgi:hypothetical protein
MVSKSVKAKRRAQAREARLIEAALMGGADLEGRYDTDWNGRFLTCYALNVQDGIAEIPEFARVLARFPRASRERWERTEWHIPAMGDAMRMSGGVEHVLRTAGLVTFTPPTRRAA